MNPTPEPPPVAGKLSMPLYVATSIPVTSTKCSPLSMNSTPPTPEAGTPSDTPTPETDAAIVEARLRYHRLYPSSKNHPVHSDFARTLERQRDSALAELARVRADAEQHSKDREYMGDIMIEMGAHPCSHNTGEKAMMEVKNIWQSVCIERDRMTAEANRYALLSAEVSIKASAAIKERDQLRADLAAAHARLKAIYDATEGYADGAPDATAHDKLCNEISAIAKL